MNISPENLKDTRISYGILRGEGDRVGFGLDEEIRSMKEFVSATVETHIPWELAEEVCILDSFIFANWKYSINMPCCKSLEENFLYNILCKASLLPLFPASLLKHRICILLSYI